MAMQKSTAGMRKITRWLAPTLHAILFVVIWLTAFHQSQPLLDGPSRWGIYLLLLIDFPISLVGFSLMWSQKFVLGLALWGVCGTLWWYFLGGIILRVKDAMDRS